MIYVDVTGACRLPLQTGIPRTTRELYRLLKGTLPDVQPVAWQPFTASYTHLSPRSEELINTPCAERRPLRKTPSDSTLPILSSAFGDLFRYFPPAIGGEYFCKRGSTLLITSIFPDNRLEYLLNLNGKQGRRLAIFHDAIPLRDPAVKGWIRGRHVKALKVFAAMDAVICVSGASEHELQRLWADHGMTPAPTYVLPWPVPMNGTRPPWSEPVPDMPSVLCVGRLKRLKNQSVLLEAAEILWEEGVRFSLTLVGCEDVPSESRQLRSQIERLQRQGYPLMWMGHVSDSQLHQCYRGSWFTVFPSLKEGMGLPILESLWHGRPVICGLDEPMASLGKGPGCLLADMRSAKNVAEVMRSLLVDGIRARELSRDAHGRPLRSWEDYLPEFTSILREVPSR
jgi:glycosyltransferase involved in cell wall biosynthesis